MFRGQCWQRDAKGQLSPWPTTLASSLCLLSPLAPTRGIPEAAALTLHHLLGGNGLIWAPSRGTTSSYWEGARGTSAVAWRGGRPTLALFTRVLAFSPHSPEDSSLSRLLPLCKHAARLGAPLPPPHAPACNVSEPCSPALWPQSARPAFSVHSPSWTSGLKEGLRRNEAHQVLTSSELKVRRAMESAPGLLRL